MSQKRIIEGIAISIAAYVIIQWWEKSKGANPANTASGVSFNNWGGTSPTPSGAYA